MQLHTKLIAGGLAALLALATVNSFYYTVAPSEMANVRRLGNVRFEKPVGAGPHFKWPIIDTVDHLQVSLRTLHIPEFSVNTIDNQKITLGINFNYTVPAESVNGLLYGVGKSGSSGIDDAIIPVAKDRAGRVFNQYNTTDISKNREAIQRDVTERVFEAVTKQFGLKPHSLQIAKIGYSVGFISTNENAVREKNNAVAETIGEEVKKNIADQAVIRAEGAAKANVERARGDSESAVVNAEAEKEKQELDGQGQAALLNAQIQVFGSVELFEQYMQAQTALKWDGQRAKVEVGGKGITTVLAPTPAP